MGSDWVMAPMAMPEPAMPEDPMFVMGLSSAKAAVAKSVATAAAVRMVLKVMSIVFLVGPRAS